MLSLIPSHHPHVRELTYATWFHDCVYNPQAKHGINEMESIRLWEAYVEEQGDELTDIKEIVTLLIQSTITHTLPSDVPALSSRTELAKRFLDMDMDILASTRSKYLEYTQKVRHEYSYYSGEEFKKGRIAFLKSELEKERVFLLEENEDKNDIAFENMRAEIEGWESGESKVDSAA
ncbi:hypothetical protein N0V90_009711 [Kalmusia sp. IMI 367209]|nr:hypothetical protein N0V90_009711 [Kalmusia sp. IMI 367209]